MRFVPIKKKNAFCCGFFFAAWRTANIGLVLLFFLFFAGFNRTSSWQILFWLVCLPSWLFCLVHIWVGCWEACQSIFGEVNYYVGKCECEFFAETLSFTWDLTLSVPICCTFEGKLLGKSLENIFHFAWDTHFSTMMPSPVSNLCDFYIFAWLCCCGEWRYFRGDSLHKFCTLWGFVFSLI